MVAKQAFKGPHFAKIPILVKLTAILLVIRTRPILMSCWVKKIKVRFVGSCATVLALLLGGSSILFIKGFHTCELSIQMMNRLKIKMFILNYFKTITDPKQDCYSSVRISHVMPTALIGGGARSFLMFRQKLKVFEI